MEDDGCAAMVFRKDSGEGGTDLVCLMTGIDVEVDFIDRHADGLLELGHRYDAVG